MSPRLFRNILLALLLLLFPGSMRLDRAGPRIVPRLGRGRPPASLGDVRLEAERRASVAWESRTGPERRVVDLVCLVPDLPTFLAAIAAWDEHRFFPILFENSEFSLKFLRAFRPARVVRLPGQAQSLAAGQSWDEAVAAVGRAWVGDRIPEAEAPPGDAVPDRKRFGPTPPGIVVSAPESPLLAGAVALAAGRFQPLLRWEPEYRFADRIPETEARRLAQDLEARIADRIPHYAALGDDCDFVTMAGDWPYGYETEQGVSAFDDLLFRSSGANSRRAYVGRLIGAPEAGLYAAMCSLFLQPESALLFNTYDRPGPVWSDYDLEPAAERLASALPVTLRQGPGQADRAGWHRTFDPVNRAGLVLINTSGSPSLFHLPDGMGQTADVPFSVPTAVLKIHSFSAADPTNPDTLAGRWLAYGSFVYFGAMNEPYLQSFRTPSLVAALLADRLPMGAAVRKAPGEPLSHPWRLVYLGDPLYRLIPARQRRPRVTTGAAWSTWPASPEPEREPPSGPEEAKLEWALRVAVAACLRREGSSAPEPAAPTDAVLLSIHRGRLNPTRQVVFDRLLADRLEQTGRDQAELRRRITLRVDGPLSQTLLIRLETSRMIDLHRHLAEHDQGAAVRAWRELVDSGTAADLVATVTERTAVLADTPERLRFWRDRLREALRTERQRPGAIAIERELRRVEARAISY